MTIIINLKGGLGNQMFQYACGRALSLRSNDAELKLNTFGLARANEVGDIYRPYSLSHFDIKATIATADEVQGTANPFGLLSRVLRYGRSKYLDNFYIHFVPSVLKRRGRVYLDGYFQSEKYFRDYAEDIRSDLMLKDPSVRVSDWKQKISQDPESVSVHIRRGDYVGHATLGGIATPEYYAAAIEQISKLKAGCRFYIFSDDVAWVEDHLTFPSKPEYISSPDLKDYEELAIMSSCKHNIIANSSFSWWAAWLNANPTKVVIAPSPWAHGKSGAKQTRDIIPESWLRIKSGK